ncbi:alpha-amylase family glycosyl hydrolase, partial [Hydrotalea sp.]
YVPGKFKTPEPDGYKLPGFKQIYTRWDSVFATKGWGTIYLGNHDQPRMVTRWGDDSPEFREPSSKMLTTFLLSMRATPYYYFGDELGMSNIKFDKIDDYRDIETLNMYKKIQHKGGNLLEFLNAQKISARDNGRTPFQWNKTPNAGFTTGTPWIKVNPNYTTVNEEDEAKNPNSCLNYFKKMVLLRKTHKDVLVYGKYQLLDPDNPKIYAYIRGEGPNKVLVLLNFSKDRVGWDVPEGLQIKPTPLINNYNTFVPGKTITLEPYQAVIVELQ